MIFKFNKSAISFFTTVRVTPQSIKNLINVLLFKLLSTNADQVYRKTAFEIMFAFFSLQKRLLYVTNHHAYHPRKKGGGIKF